MAGNKAVFSVYRDHDSLADAIEALKAAGYANFDISIVFQESDRARIFREKPEIAGMSEGGIFGWLTGIAALSASAIGPLIAAGPLASLLAGTGAGGTTGDIAGTLSEMGVPEYLAKRYETRVKEGNILLSVHSGNTQLRKRAREIMASTGAEEIGMEEEARAA